MHTKQLASRVRGCVLGAALGDAIGGPFEFGPLERVPALTGGTWIDGLYPYLDTIAPHNVWPHPDGGLPPAGTGTDDVRLDWLYLELAIELKRAPTARDLALRYIEIYEHPEIVFPGHHKLTRAQFAHWEGACRGYLGQTSAQYPGLTPELLLARGLGLNFPILSGLYALTMAGLLYPGQPIAAYKAAFLSAFYDIGYAREATALLAACIATAIAEEIAPRALYERALAWDPFHLGGPFSKPFVKGHLPQCYVLVADPQPDAEVALALSTAFRHYHPMDPFRTLAVALLSVLVAEEDPLRAMTIAANHVGIDDKDRPTRYEDIDCYASIAGALAGALWGAEALPQEMVAQVIESNKAVYGIDLEATIERFCDLFTT
jgi:ADP-ribosylglycohydrolase